MLMWSLKSVFLSIHSVGVLTENSLNARSSQTLCELALVLEIDLNVNMKVVLEGSVDPRAGVPGPPGEPLVS